MSFKKLTTTPRSVVMGHWVKLSPANTTSPKRSFSRAFTNSIPTSFDASSRLGLKSIALILPDTSMHITISIPSVVTCSHLLEDWGRARATTMSITTASRSRKSRCRSQILDDPTFSSRFSKPDRVIELVLFLPLKIYHTTITGSSASTQKKAGYANSRLLMTLLLLGLFILFLFFHKEHWVGLLYKEIGIVQVGLVIHREWILPGKFDQVGQFKQFL